jgi:hypothetical protein
VHVSYRLPDFTTQFANREPAGCGDAISRNGHMTGSEQASIAYVRDSVSAADAEA